MVDLGQLAPGGTPPGLPAPGLAAPGLVALRLSDLTGQGATSQARSSPVYGPFHLLMLVSVGYGQHSIDFRRHPCRPGTLLWGRPGQVHQFGAQPGLDATLLLFSPEALPPVPALADLLDDPFAPACWQPTGEDADAILAELTQLAADCARYRLDDPRGEALLRHQVAVLLARIAAQNGQPAAGTPTSGTAQLMARLRTELEASYALSRRVEEYAERLGCSVRTLTRACLTATGRSAKQLVDARVALAAQRMLACSEVPVAEVGRRLGFPEPTNFGRFFVRETGATPGDFRAAVAPR